MSIKRFLPICLVVALWTPIQAQNSSSNLIVFHTGLEDLESDQQVLFKELVNSKLRSNGFNVINPSSEEVLRVQNCDNVSCAGNVVPQHRNIVLIKWRSLAGTYLITGFAGSTGTQKQPYQFSEASQNVDLMVSRIIPDLTSEISAQFNISGTTAPVNNTASLTSQNRQSQDVVTTDVNYSSDGLSFEQSSTDLRSEQIIDAWKRRGGQISSNSFGAGVSYMSYESEFEGGDMWMEGSGFNLSLGIDQMGLNPPKLRNGKLSNWSAFKFGAAMDMTFFNVATETYIDGFGYMNSESSQTQINFPFNVGYSFGIGAGESLRWRGVVFSLNWAPSYQIIIPEEGDNIEDFNFSGFSFDLDFATLNSALDKQLKEPQNRFSFFILPPLENMPAFISISYKRVYY